MLVAACCAALVGATACTASTGGAPSATTGPVSGEAAGRYGQAPQRDPSGFTYQPDVVVVDGGGGAVRSVSADGMVWTVDGSATGMSDLAVGEVLFLTSRAAGRVAAMDRSGADVDVALVPAQLGEIVRDGRIRLDSEVDLDDAAIQEVPDLPGALGIPDGSDNDLPRMGAAPLVALGAPGGRRLPPPAKVKADIGIGPWGITPSFDKNGLGLSLSYKPADNLKVGVDVTLGFKSLRVVSDVTLVGGNLSGNTKMIIHGIDHLDVKVHAGVANGVEDNKKVRLEIPAEVFNTPFVVGGLPMVFNFKVKMFVETALTGKNSVLTAQGRWGLNGPIGISGATASLPSFTVMSSILDSLGGIVLGPSGIVFGAEFKAMLGVGFPGAAAGPYAKLRTSVGLTNGSAFGAPLARCTRADLIIKGGGGFGLSLSGAATDAISKRIPGAPKIKADLEAELMSTIAERSQTRPDVPLCTGG